MTATLVCSGIDRVRIVGVDDNFGKAGVLAYVQNFLPGLAAVARFVKSAIAAG